MSPFLSSIIVSLCMQNYEYGFYVLAIFTILTVVIVVLKRKAIQIAVGIMRRSSICLPRSGSIRRR